MPVPNRDDLLLALKMGEPEARSEALTALTAYYTVEFACHRYDSACQTALAVVSSGNSFDTMPLSSKLEWAERGVVAAAAEPPPQPLLYRALTLLARVFAASSMRQRARVAHVAACHHATSCGHAIDAARAGLAAAAFASRSSIGDELAHVAGLARQSSNAKEKMAVLREVGTRLVETGHYDRALHILEESIPFPLVEGDIPWTDNRIYSLDALATAYSCTERWDMAVTAWESFARTWRASTYLDRDNLVGLAIGGIGDVRRRQARGEEARQLLCEARQLTRGTAPLRVELPMALLEFSDGNQEEGESLATHVLNVLERKWGKESEQYLDAQSRLCAAKAG